MHKSVDAKEINKLPKKPGVYFLKNKAGNIFYIGKSANLRARAQSHARENRSEKIHKVQYITTKNEIEALLLESQMIKKYDPPLNIRLRDDKKYFYVGLTREDLPRIFITHQPLQATSYKLSTYGRSPEGRQAEYLGPFTDGGALKLTMKYLRRLFPYYKTNPKKPLTAKTHSALPCQWCRLGQCPGPEPRKTQYRKNINAIKNILKGRGKNVLRQLERAMKKEAEKENYEKAAEIRDIAEALSNILEHSRIAVPWHYEKTQDTPVAFKNIKTIEGYDISNIQGKNATGAMVRFADFSQIYNLDEKSSIRRSSTERRRISDWRPDKNMYRKFNIKAPAEPNDYLMMKEIIKRRFAREEWPWPDLILIDGGAGQLSAALEVVRKFETRNSKSETNSKLPHVAALAKREEELYLPNKKRPIMLSSLPTEVENLLKRVRDEAHRFAVSHHRHRRSKNFKK